MFLISFRNVRVSLFVLTGIFFLGSSLGYAGAPYTDAEIRSVETSNELKLREIRAQEIIQLKITLQRKKSSEQHAELFFRLAELYLEAYRAEFILEGRVHEKRLEKKLDDSVIDRSHSRPQLKAGIQICENIIHSKSSFEKMPEVYYFLGFYNAELENLEESHKYYSILIQNHPHHPLSGVAYQELGNHAYSLFQFQKAQKLFESALAIISPEAKPPIMHKLAWSYYRTKQYDRAVLKMKETIAECSKNQKYRILKDDALKDIASFLTETGRVNEAIHYFEGVTGDQKIYPALLEKLGRQYERNVDLVNATFVYESILKTHPNSDSASRVSVKLVELDLKQGNLPKALLRLGGFFIPETMDSETQELIQGFKALIRKTATEHHQLYRKSQARVDLEVAKGFYSAYLEHFFKSGDPKHEVPEIQMYLAEVEHELGNYKEVAELYKKIVLSKDERYAKEAALLWTTSLIEAINDAHKKEMKQSNEPSQLESDFISAADLLSQTLAQSNEAKEAFLRSSQILAGYEKTREESIRRIQQILNQWPDSKQALVAAQLWIQISSDRSKKLSSTDELENVISEIRKKSNLLENDKKNNHGSLAVNLTEQDRQVKILKIAKYEKNQDYLAAAKGYENFAAESQSQEIAENAYSNALNLILKEKEPATAFFNLISVWVKRFPSSQRARNSLRVAGTHFFIKREFATAAKVFEKVGIEFKDFESLETSGKIFEEIGETKLSQSDRKDALKLNTSETEAARVALALAQSYENEHSESEAIKYYRFCTEKKDLLQIECHARLGDLYSKNKDYSNAKLNYQNAAQSTIAKNGSSPFIGYARYRLAELSESEKKFEPLQFPETQIKVALAQRLNFIEPLSQAYQSAVSAGGPWALASLHRLALWVVHFADEVDSIEPPSSMKSADLEKFRKSLLSVTQPLRMRAKETWNDSYQKANQLNLLSPVLPEIVDHLTDFGVMSPVRAQGPRGGFRISDVTLEGASLSESNTTPIIMSQLLKNAKDPIAWIAYGNSLSKERLFGLAKIAYQRALELRPNHPVALNNLAAVLVSGDGEENWMNVGEASHLFQLSLKENADFLPAKVNLALLNNYYRLFRKSKSYWEQVLLKMPESIEALEGLAIAHQGLGELTRSVEIFTKIREMGIDLNRFSYVYNESARAWYEGTEGLKICSSLLSTIPKKWEGYEKSSAEYLREKCNLWKSKK